MPTKASLDRVAPGHPVSLRRIDGHARWVNSAALRAAGIDSATPDPFSGTIRREDGDPTGVLLDNAQLSVERIEPIPADDAFDLAVREAIDKCLAVGLTGVHEMGIKRWALASYRRLIERGQFPFRNYAAIDGRWENLWAEYRERGPETFGDAQLVVAAVKLWADGALGSRGAALHDSYCDDPDDPDNKGLVLVPPDEIERLTVEAMRQGFQVCVHAIGDRANTLTLDAFERALTRAPALGEGGS